MFQILCPTDFSEASKDASKWAIGLANKMDATLHFVTTHHIPRMVGRLSSYEDKVVTYLEEDLRAFFNGVRDLVQTDQKPVFRVLEGNTVSSICDYAADHNIQLIVMGTKGNSSITKMMLGSVTRDVFAKSKVPVLAIPESYLFDQHDKNIVLALDAKGIENLKSIQLLADLKSFADFTLNVIHVSEKGEKVDLVPNTKLLASMIDQLVDVTGEDVIYEIKNYASEKKAAMIAMAHKKHSFFHRFFLESFTEETLFSADTAVLMLPE